MSHNENSKFNKNNIDTYLKLLSKDFRKRNGTKIKAEIILVGGAAILTDYNFRDTTIDIDAIIQASSVMKESISAIADQYDLPVDWLNNDFVRTSSYSPNLILYSKYHRTFSNILSIRTVTAEYLIAMKLCSARSYKNDLSDIFGILLEHEQQGNPITFQQIDEAVINLYGDWSRINSELKEKLAKAMESKDYEQNYQVLKQQEEMNLDKLLDFNKKYQKVLNEKNVEQILSSLNNKNNN